MAGRERARKIDGKHKFAVTERGNITFTARNAVIRSLIEARYLYCNVNTITHLSCDCQRFRVLVHFYFSTSIADDVMPANAFFY